MSYSISSTTTHAIVYRHTQTKRGPVAEPIEAICCQASPENSVRIFNWIQGKKKEYAIN